MSKYYWKHYCKVSKNFVFISDKSHCWKCGEEQSGPLTQIYTDEHGRNLKVTVDFHDQIHTHPLANIKVL